MIVYIAHYCNGGIYDDYCEWSGDKVYMNEKDCEKEILEEGYYKSENESNLYYLDEYQRDCASIGEIELVK